MGTLKVKTQINKIKFNDSTVNIQLIMMLQSNVKTVHNPQQHSMALNL